MNRTLLLSTVVLGLGGAAVAAQRVPYANDFATRTSGVTPSERWMEVPYSTGLIARPYSTYSYRIPYYQGDKVQDGWAMPAANAADNFSYAVINDNGNQALEAKATVSGKDVTAAIVQPLYSEFTTGVVRFSVDLRTPTQGSSMPSSTDDKIYLAPVWKSGIDCATGRYSDSPLLFGLSGVKDSESGDRSFRAYISCSSDNGTGSKSYAMYDTLTYGNWYRYEIEVNLDDNTSQCSYTDLGTTHPTAASTGTKVVCRKWDHPSAPTAFPNRLRASNSAGGIAGLGIYVNLVKDGPAEQLPLFDNISVAWKPSATDNYTIVYENDFTTRRYRSLGGTTAGTYEPQPIELSQTSASYGRGSLDNVYGAGDDSLQRLVPDYVGAKGALEPTGVDGWRRFEGRMRFGLVDPNKTTSGYGWKNGAVLRATATSSACSKSSAHAFLSHPIGTELTSGKVRLYFDLMAPGKWQYPSDMAFDYCGIYLGSAVDAPFITGSNDAKTILTNKVSFGAGYYSNGSNGGTSTSTKWSASGATVVYSSLTGIDSAAPGVARWYRFRLTADLDAKTFDIQAYLAGAVGPAMTDASFLTDANRRLDVQGRAFSASAPAKIDSVIIGIGHAAAYADKTQRSGDAYYVGNYPLIDSIRVCKVNADGTDGADIYANDFETCTRTVEREASVIGTATDRPGADGWVARGVLPNQVYAAGSNPAVVLNGSLDYAQRVVQPLGVASKGAAKMTVSADVRPPRVWTKSGGSLSVELGDDEYAQGNLSSTRSYLSAPRISFGFREPGTQAKKAYGYTNCCFAVTSANGTTTASALPYRDGARNWYRFKATLDPAAGTFAVAVYDQGATQPTSAGADGTLVATFADQPLPALTGLGFSTLGLSGSGVAGSRGFDADDPDVALVDNLSVDSTPQGLMFLVR